jgi:hypothetical protein
VGFYERGEELSFVGGNMKYFLKTFFFLFFATVCGAKEGGKLQPPAWYEDVGACPFECCTYQNWNATKEVWVFEKPKGRRHLRTISKGATVFAETGIVYTKPSKMKILYPHQEENGDLFEEGEFFSHLPIWVKESTRFGTKGKSAK